MARILAISGTPGTGKTSVATELTKRLHAEVISFSTFVEEHALYDSWDADLATRIVDEEKARESLIVEIGRARKREDIDWLVIEGLMADIIADRADNVVVLRVDPRVVKKRLARRGYNHEKVAENVQSELLGTCTYHMQEAIGKRFADIDTTGKDIPAVASLIIAVLEGRERDGAYDPGLIDWISHPDIDPATFF